MSKTLSDLPIDLHHLILSHDEEKIQLKKENEKLKTRVKMLQCLLDEARQDNDSDEYEDDEWDGKCEECCRGKGDRPQINCVCERCDRIICRDCQANSHYVPDTCDFCWEKFKAIIDADQYDENAGDKIIDEIDEHNKCFRHLCERREHLSIKTAFKQWVKKDE